MENEYLGFVKLIGNDVDGQYIYEFLFTDNIEEFFGENFEYKPCGLCTGLTPFENSYNVIKVVKTEIKFDLIQDSNCFGFQDCIDDCVALCFENIDDYEEYPEEGRTVFHFGDSYDEVAKELAMKNILMEDK